MDSGPAQQNTAEVGILRARILRASVAPPSSGPVESREPSKARMPHSLLLIVNGESLDSPQLSRHLEAGDWECAWASAEQVPGLALAGVSPDLVLLVPGLAPERQAPLRAFAEGTPMVVLAAGPGTAEIAPELSISGYLDPAQPMARWGDSLRLFLPVHAAEGGKFSAEDLFGDILAEMEAPAAPAPPVQPPAPAVPAPPKPAVPSVPVPKLMLPRPIAATPKPAHQVVADLLGALGPDKAPVLPPEEFTFSGFSGINDPFGKAVLPEDRPAPEPAPSPVPVPEPSAASQQVSLSAPEPVPGMPALEEFGNYYLLEKIAVGGMAELFKARQRGVANFEKIVAIKRILPHLSDNDEFVRMFIDEAKLAAQLTHPNIAQIYDLGKASGFYYIAMEYVDGKDLRSLLRKVREYRQPIPEPVAAFVAMKVAGALDHAHRKKGINGKDLKLVHRDISPQNILISNEGAVKLVDFGIAKAATKSTQTMAGALKGKLLYMSPEQALGQHLDSRSDIYSLGLVLFELLTGERCFQADSELGVLEKVRLGKVQDVQAVNPKVSREMADILQRALQKDVDQRYPSARFLERDLKALLSRQGSEPTEHDVAEYANTLLKGTREQLDLLVSTQFSLKPSPSASGSFPILPVSTEVTLNREDLPTPALREKPAPVQPLEPMAMPDFGPEAEKTPGWRRPLLIGAGLLLLLLVLWFALR